MNKLFDDTPYIDKSVITSYDKKSGKKHSKNTVIVQK